MAGKFGLKDGTEYLPRYNWGLGMNDDLAYADRAGWQTSVAMLTGGQPMDWDDLGALEVGNQYDLDPMGEDRGMTTFSDDVPRAMGHVGMMTAEGGAPMQAADTEVSGKRVNLSTPQTYNSVGAMKKG